MRKGIKRGKRIKRQEVTRKKGGKYRGGEQGTKKREMSRDEERG